MIIFIIEADFKFELVCEFVKHKNSDEKSIKSIKKVLVLFIIRNAKKKNELFSSSTFSYFFKRREKKILLNNGIFLTTGVPISTLSC